MKTVENCRCGAKRSFKSDMLLKDVFFSADHIENEALELENIQEELSTVPNKRLNQLVLGRILQLTTDGSDIDVLLIEELRRRVDGLNAQYISRGEGE